MSEARTQYILEYRYDGEDDNAWREEAVFDNTSDAHCAFSEHVKQFVHIVARVRRVRSIVETNVIARFEPISSEDYSA